MTPSNRPGRPARGTLNRRTFLGAAGVAAGGAILGGGRGVGAIAAPVQGANRTTSVPDPSIAGEITIWDRAGDLFQVFDGVIPAFNEVYPNVRVNHEEVDIDTKLPNALITGAGLPDGSFWDDAKIPSQSAHLTDLTDYLAPYTADTVDYKLDVNTADGRIYGVPWDLDPGLLYYRADILDEAGIDPASITTYAGLLDAARTVKSTVNSDAGPIHLDRSPFLGQLWLEMLANQLGTSMADADGNVRLDSDEYRTIFNWIDEARTDGLVTHTEYLDPTDLQLLDDGTQVFVPWAIWWDVAPQLLLEESKGLWRAMRLPAWTEGGSRTGIMGGSSFLIPAEARNPELAWRFYEFLAYHQAGYTAVYGPNEIYPGGLNTSIPSYEPALDPGMPLFDPIPELGDQDLWSLAVEAGLEAPRGTPLPSWWAAAVDYLGNNLQRLIEATMTPDEVIERSTAEIEENLVSR